MLGSSMGMGMAPGPHPDVTKKFQMTNFTMPNNSCSLKCAPKSVPGLADVEVLLGVEVFAGLAATKAI